MHSPDCSITPDDWPHGYGFCWCGCGQKTTVSQETDTARGWAKGVPRKYILGHSTRGKARPLAERFWEKVDVRGPDECWPWKLTLDRRGYGQFNVGSHRAEGAHRTAWRLTRGAIPDGLTLDHLCRNRACQNPAHLEPVTIAENVLRGESLRAQNKRKTHCKHGHAFSPENTHVTPMGHRECLTCQKKRNDARRRKFSYDAAGKRTHCERGHEFTPENTYTRRNGWRVCRTCQRNEPSALAQRAHRRTIVH